MGRPRMGTTLLTTTAVICSGAMSRLRSRPSTSSPSSSPVERSSVCRRKSATRSSPSNTPRTTLVLPTSMASSMGWDCGSAGRCGERAREMVVADRVAARHPPVAPGEALVAVLHPEPLQRLVQRAGAEVHVVLVAVAGVEVDGAQPAQLVGVALSHAHRVVGQPALPVGGDDAPPGVDGQPDAEGL